MPSQPLSENENMRSISFVVQFAGIEKSMTIVFDDVFSTIDDRHLYPYYPDSVPMSVVRARVLLFPASLTACNALSFSPIAFPSLRPNVHPSLTLQTNRPWFVTFARGKKLSGSWRRRMQLSRSKRQHPLQLPITAPGRGRALQKNSNSPPMTTKPRPSCPPGACVRRMKSAQTKRKESARAERPV